MSDTGGSDLDVFDNLNKDSSPARKKTLVGMAAPAPGSQGRTSVPPPPPPSLRASAAPPAPPSITEAEAEEIEEVDAVEEVSSPDATLASAEDVQEVEPDEPSSPIFDEDDATRVFDGLGSSAEASAEPPTPLAAPASSPSTTSGPLPPPPSPGSIPSAGLPPPTASGSLPPPPPPFRSSGPPPPPPTPSAAPQAQAPDWDEDEEDKTTVFQRESGFDAAYMLRGTSQVGSVPVGSVPDVPPPPMSRPSAPIPSPPVVSMPTGGRAEELRPGSMPPAPASKMPLVLGAVAAVALGIALFFILKPSTGGLVVTVAGPGNRPLSGVEVIVDGKVACNASPCPLQDLPAGTHMVQARADGYSQTAEAAVLVTGGEDAVHNIRLAQASGTGVRVTGTGPGLRLYVNGEDKGPLPQELKQMSAGSHRIKVAGEHFETWEKTVTVTEEQVEHVEVPKLKVVKGLAVIKAGDNAKGARVVLESDGDRRVLPSLPMNLHIDTSKPHTLVASRKGYETFREELSFEDGQAEKTFEVVLQRPSDAHDDTPSPQARPRPRPTPRPSPGKSPSTSASGQAVLNLNSIPASNVLLDGRPVGRTPKLGLKVSPGPHSVVFVHEGKRANKSVNATAGKTSTVVHRFQ